MRSKTQTIKKKIQPDKNIFVNNNKLVTNRTASSEASGGFDPLSRSVRVPTTAAALPRWIVMSRRCLGKAVVSNIPSVPRNPPPNVRTDFKRARTPRTEGLDRDRCVAFILLSNLKKN